MITIKTYLRIHKQDSETGIVWVKFYVSRELVNFTTGIKIKTEHWDMDKVAISRKDPQAKDKAIVIDNILARINNVLVKYRLRDRKITRDSFLRAYNRPDDYDTFFNFIKDHYANMNFKNELSTIKTHQYVISKIEDYAPTLHFDDITVEWLDEYYIYLRRKLNNTENTAYKNMSILRKYVRYAYKKGYMDENPFDNWKIKRTKASYTYLTEDELNIFINAYREGVFDYRHHKTIEFFLFMCFSSLHVTDAKLLTLEQFNDSSFTYFRIKNKNKKPEPIIVPLSNILKEIIRNIVGLRKKGLIFDKLPTDQTMNRYLKEIAKSLGVDKKISHKTGRHTFATYFLSKTKDLTTLKEILGHSELRETLIYAHVLDEDKQIGIKSFDSFSINKNKKGTG